MRNDGAVDAGCQLTATAHDAFNTPVGFQTTIPAAGNIIAGETEPFSFIISNLTVPASQVVRVDVTVSATLLLP